jgi:hypothetical protein
MWNVCSQLLIIRKSIDHRLAFCVRAFRRATRVIGGIVTATWARAALLAAYRWIVDSRDHAKGERRDAIEDSFRLYRMPVRE